MLDDDGKTEGWGWSAELACDGERERKKRMADEWEETRHCYGTYRETAQAKCIKGYENTNTLPTCNRQWKLTVNSQKQSGNDTATVPHAGRLHRNKKKIKSVSLHELNPSLLPQHTKNKDSGQWCNGPNSHEDRQKQGIQHAQQVVHTGENPQICVDFTTTFFFSHSAGGKSFKKKNKWYHALSITNPLALTRHQSNI